MHLFALNSLSLSTNCNFLKLTSIPPLYKDQGVMLTVWVSGCLGVRVSGCQRVVLKVRMSGCLGVRVSRRQVVKLSGCQGVMLTATEILKVPMLMRHLATR